MKKFVILAVSIVFGFAATQPLFAQGDASAGQAKSALCATCHGAEGNSEISINPKLAGQNVNYIIKAGNGIDYCGGKNLQETLHQV